MLPPSGFAPVIGQSVILNATTASSTVTLSSTLVDNKGIATSYPAGKGISGVTAGQIRVYNAGPNAVAIRWGLAALGTVTAVATTDMVIPSGNTETFNKGTNIDTIAGVAVTGTATVYITPGEGGG